MVACHDPQTIKRNVELTEVVCYDLCSAPAHLLCEDYIYLSFLHVHIKSQFYLMAHIMSNISSQKHAIARKE